MHYSKTASIDSIGYSLIPLIESTGWIKNILYIVEIDLKMIYFYSITVHMLQASITHTWVCISASIFIDLLCKSLLHLQGRIGFYV